MESTSESLTPVGQYLDSAGNPVTEFSDSRNGNKVVLSVGEYGSEVAETFDPLGNRVFREERFSNPSDPNSGVTIRKYDYSTGEFSYFNYDSSGRLYNSSYTDGKVSVLLRDGGIIDSALVDPDANYGWSEIADSIPEEFANSNAGDAPIILHKGDQQLGIEPDGETPTYARVAEWLRDPDRAFIISEGGTEAGALGTGLSAAAQGAGSPAAKFLSRWGSRLGLVGIGTTVVDEVGQAAAGEKSALDAGADGVGLVSSSYIGGVVGASVGGPIGAAVGAYTGALLYSHKQGIIDAVNDPVDGAKKLGATVAGWFK